MFNTPNPGPDAPTPKQQRLLRELAAERGQSFITPQTKAAACREIRRLQAYPRQTDWVRSYDDVLIGSAELPQDTARVSQTEITGYGANAHWNRHHGGRS